jgi:hypothetical protein
MNRKIRYAVVGLGHIAQTAVLPAVKRADSPLVALVTGNREKNRELSERYGVNAYNYDDLEEAFEKEQVDAAYIASDMSSKSNRTRFSARTGAETGANASGELKEYYARKGGQTSR